MLLNKRTSSLVFTNTDTNVNSKGPPNKVKNCKDSAFSDLQNSQSFSETDSKASPDKIAAYSRVNPHKPLKECALSDAPKEIGIADIRTEIEIRLAKARQSVNEMLEIENKNKNKRLKLKKVPHRKHRQENFTKETQLDQETQASSRNPRFDTGDSFLNHILQQPAKLASYFDSLLQELSEKEDAIHSLRKELEITQRQKEKILASNKGNHSRTRSLRFIKRNPRCLQISRQNSVSLL